MATGLLVLLTLLAFSGLAIAQERRDSLGDLLPPGAVQRLGTLRLRYGGVGGLAYLPDGRGVILTGGCVDIWDLHKGERQSHTKVSDKDLVCVQLRSDGKTLLLGDSAGRVREWDAIRMTEVRAWDTGLTPLRSACYSPDEKRILIGADDPPRLAEWDLEGNKKIIEIKSEMVTSRCGAVYGPGGKTAIMGGGFGHNLEHYDLPTGKLLKKWCTVYEAKHLALSPDQKYVTVGLEDCAIEWSLENYKVFHYYKHCSGEAARIFWIAYLPATNEVLCAGRDGSIHRWSRASGQRVFSWMPHQSQVSPIAVSPDQKWVLSYGTGLVAETNIATGEPRLKWDRHMGTVTAAAFLASGKRVLSASADSTVRVWDTDTGKTILKITGAVLGAYALAVSPDETKVAVGCKDGKVREFSLTTGKLIREISGHLGYVRSVTYTPDGTKLLSSADDGTIRLWGTKDDAIGLLRGHRGGVLSVAVSRDGRFVLSGGRDATVRLWDLSSAKPVRVFEGSKGWVTCVAFTPDGAYALASGRDGILRKWDLKTGRLALKTPSRGWTNALACDPDGRRAFTAAGAEGFYWDLATGQPIGALKGHQGAVTCLAVSPDGRRLVSASQDTTLLVWEVEQSKISDFKSQITKE